MSGKEDKTQTSQTNKIDPGLLDLYNKNYAKSTALADTPFQPYTGSQVAPFSSTQISGQQGLLALGNSNVGNSSLDASKTAMNGILSYAPHTITSPGTLSGRSVSPMTITPGSVEVGQLRDTNLQPYMNPYLDSVVNTSLEDLARARAIQQVNDNQASTAAGAFGGSRQAVRDSLTTNDYLRNVAGTTANLRSGAYTNAQQAALADITNRLGAGEFNANQSLSAQTSNAANRLNADVYSANSGTNADLTNINNALDVSKTNAANDLTGAGFRLTAGNQLASLSDQELRQALQKAGIIEGVGQEQTAQAQQQADAAYQEFLRQIGYPLQQQNIRNAALGMMPVQQTTTGTTTSSQNPGMTGVLNGILSLGQTAGQLGWSPFGTTQQQTAGR